MYLALTSDLLGWPFARQIAWLETHLTPETAAEILPVSSESRDPALVVFALTRLLFRYRWPSPATPDLHLALSILEKQTDTTLLRLLQAIDLEVRGSASSDIWAILEPCLLALLDRLPLKRLQAFSLVDRFLSQHRPSAHEAFLSRLLSEVQTSLASGRIPPTSFLWKLPARRLHALPLPSDLQKTWDDSFSAIASDAIAALALSPKPLSQARAEDILSQRIYDEPGHFLFELLQNADDQASKHWALLFTDEGLHVWHDGYPFDTRDLIGITSIGLSTKKRDQIGFFGVGFKSVYEITRRPQIRSGAFSFEIADVSLPRPLHPTPPDLPRPWADAGTLVTLPWRPGLSPSRSPHALFQKLRSLDPILLLTLKNLHHLTFSDTRQTLGWSLETPRPAEGQISEIQIRRLEDQGLARYCILSRSIHLAPEARLPDRPDRTRLILGFLLSDDLRPLPLPDASPRIYSFLPTAERPGFDFFLQAHFDLPVDRERITRGSAWNQTILAAVPDLLATFLALASEHTDAFLALLPSPAEIRDPFFQPIACATGRLLASLPCLLCEDGQRRSLAQVYLAEPAIARIFRQIPLPALLPEAASPTPPLPSLPPSLAALPTDALGPLWPLASDLPEPLLRKLRAWGIFHFGPHALLARLALSLDREDGLLPPSDLSALFEPTTLAAFLHWLAAAASDDPSLVAFLRTLPLLLDTEGRIWRPQPLSPDTPIPALASPLLQDAWGSARLFLHPTLADDPSLRPFLQRLGCPRLHPHDLLSDLKDALGGEPFPSSLWPSLWQAPPSAILRALGDLPPALWPSLRSLPLFSDGSSFLYPLANDPMDLAGLVLLPLAPWQGALANLLSGIRPFVLETPEGRGWGRAFEPPTLGIADLLASLEASPTLWQDRVRELHTFLSAAAADLSASHAKTLAFLPLWPCKGGRPPTPARGLQARQTPDPSDRSSPLPLHFRTLLGEDRAFLTEDPEIPALLPHLAFVELPALSSEGSPTLDHLPLLPVPWIGPLALACALQPTHDQPLAIPPLGLDRLETFQRFFLKNLRALRSLPSHEAATIPLWLDHRGDIVSADALSSSPPPEASSLLLQLPSLRFLSPERPEQKELFCALRLEDHTRKLDLLGLLKDNLAASDRLPETRRRDLLAWLLPTLPSLPPKLLQEAFQSPIWPDVQGRLGRLSAWPSPRPLDAILWAFDPDIRLWSSAAGLRLLSLDFVADHGLASLFASLGWREIDLFDLQTLTALPALALGPSSTLPTAEQIPLALALRRLLRSRRSLFFQDPPSRPSGPTSLSWAFSLALWRDRRGRLHPLDRLLPLPLFDGLLPPDDAEALTSEAEDKGSSPLSPGFEGRQPPARPSPPTDLQTGTALGGKKQPPARPSTPTDLLLDLRLHPDDEADLADLRDLWPPTPVFGLCKGFLLQSLRPGRTLADQPLFASSLDSLQDTLTHLLNLAKTEALPLLPTFRDLPLFCDIHERLRKPPLLRALESERQILQGLPLADTLLHPVLQDRLPSDLFDLFPPLQIQAFLEAISSPRPSHPPLHGHRSLQAHPSLHDPDRRLAWYAYLRDHWPDLTSSPSLQAFWYTADVFGTQDGGLCSLYHLSEPESLLPPALQALLDAHQKAHPLPLSVGLAPYLHAIAEASSASDRTSLLDGFDRLDRFLSSVRPSLPLASGSHDRAAPPDRGSRDSKSLVGGSGGKAPLEAELLKLLPLRLPAADGLFHPSSKLHSLDLPSWFPPSFRLDPALAERLSRPSLQPFQTTLGLRTTLSLPALLSLFQSLRHPSDLPTDAASIAWFLAASLASSETSLRSDLYESHLPLLQDTAWIVTSSGDLARPTDLFWFDERLASLVPDPKRFPSSRYEELFDFKEAKKLGFLTIKHLHPDAVAAYLRPEDGASSELLAWLEHALKQEKLSTSTRIELLRKLRIRTSDGQIRTPDTILAFPPVPWLSRGRGFWPEGGLLYPRLCRALAIPLQLEPRTLTSWLEDLANDVIADDDQGQALFQREPDLPTHLPSIYAALGRLERTSEGGLFSTPPKELANSWPPGSAGRPLLSLPFLLAKETHTGSLRLWPAGTPGLLTCQTPFLQGLLESQLSFHLVLFPEGIDHKDLLLFYQRCGLPSLEAEIRFQTARQGGGKDISRSRQGQIKRLQERLRDIFAILPRIQAKRGGEDEAWIYRHAFQPLLRPDGIKIIEGLRVEVNLRGVGSVALPDRVAYDSQGRFLFVDSEIAREPQIASAAFASILEPLIFESPQSGLLSDLLESLFRCPDRAALDSYLDQRHYPRLHLTEEPPTPSSTPKGSFPTPPTATEIPLFLPRLWDSLRGRSDASKPNPSKPPSQAKNPSPLPPSPPPSPASASHASPPKAKTEATSKTGKKNKKSPPPGSSSLPPQGSSRDLPRSQPPDTSLTTPSASERSPKPPPPDSRSHLSPPAPPDSRSQTPSPSHPPPPPPDFGRSPTSPPPPDRRSPLSPPSSDRAIQPKPPPPPQTWNQPNDAIDPQFDMEPGALDAVPENPEGLGLFHEPALLPTPWRYALQTLTGKFEPSSQRWLPLPLPKDLRWTGSEALGEVAIQGRIPPGDALLPLPLFARRQGEIQIASDDPKAKGGLRSEGPGPLVIHTHSDAVIQVSYQATIFSPPEVDEIESKFFPRNDLHDLYRKPTLPRDSLPEAVSDLLSEIESRSLSALAAARWVEDVIRRRYRYDLDFLQRPEIQEAQKRLPLDRGNRHLALMHAAPPPGFWGTGVCYELNLLLAEILRHLSIPSLVATAWVLDQGFLSKPDHLIALAFLPCKGGGLCLVPFDGAVTSQGRVQHRPLPPSRERPSLPPKKTVDPRLPSLQEEIQALQRLLQRLRDDGFPIPPLSPPSGTTFAERQAFRSHLHREASSHLRSSDLVDRLLAILAKGHLDTRDLSDTDKALLHLGLLRTADIRQYRLFPSLERHRPPND